MAFQLPDSATPFGARVARRLHEEHIIWLTTVDAKGMPQPNPVWFLWDDVTSTMLIYTLPDAKRVAHIQHNPRVALNLDGSGTGGDIIIITGEARFGPDEPPANQVPAYMEKYRGYMARLNYDPQGFAAKYSVALRIYPTKVRGL